MLFHGAKVDFRLCPVRGAGHFPDFLHVSFDLTPIAPGLILLADNAHIFGHRLISQNRAIFINGNRVGPCWYVDGLFSAGDMQLKRDRLALRDGGDDLLT